MTRYEVRSDRGLERREVTLSAARAGLALCAAGCWIVGIQGRRHTRIDTEPMALTQAREEIGGSVWAARIETAPETTAQAEAEGEND